VGGYEQQNKSQQLRAHDDLTLLHGIVSSAVEVVGANVQGGEGRAPAARPVEATGSPAAAPLVIEEAMASAAVVVSGAGSPLPRSVSPRGRHPQEHLALHCPGSSLGSGHHHAGG
jgi:hypothetical protein